MTPKETAEAVGAYLADLILEVEHGGFSSVDYTEREIAVYPLVPVLIGDTSQQPEGNYSASAALHSLRERINGAIQQLPDVALACWVRKRVYQDTWAQLTERFCLTTHYVKKHTHAADDAIASAFPEILAYEAPEA